MITYNVLVCTKEEIKIYTQKEIEEYSYKFDCQHFDAEYVAEEYASQYLDCEGEIDSEPGEDLVHVFDLDFKHLGSFEVYGEFIKTYWTNEVEIDI